MSRRESREWVRFPAEIGQNAEGELWAFAVVARNAAKTADLIEPQHDGFCFSAAKIRIINSRTNGASLTQIEHELYGIRGLPTPIAAATRNISASPYGAALNADGIAALRDQGRAAVADALKRHSCRHAGHHRPAPVTGVSPTAFRRATLRAKIAAADFQTVYRRPNIAR